MLKCIKYRFSEAPQNYWDFVHKYGTIFQCKPYLNFQAVTDGREPVVLAILDGDEIVGGAAVRVGPGMWHFRSGASTYFGPVVANQEKFPDVFNCMTKVMKSMSLVCSVEVPPQYAEILSKHSDFKGWVKKELEYLHWDISAPIDVLLKTLPKGKEAAIKRARREGVVIEEIGSNEQVRQFYRLHSLSMERGERAPWPITNYETLINMLKPVGMATGFLALHPATRQPIASVILLLGTNGDATYLAVGHDYEFRHLGSTDLLVLHCVEFLKSKGYVMFDLVGLPKGDSPRAKGIRHFKTAWAGDNGRCLPSYALTCSIWGVNPSFILKNINFAQRCFRILQSFKKEQRKISWGHNAEQ